MKFQVWYCPQMPMKAFEVETSNALEAEKILGVLEDFSLFEFENRVKPDYADVGGIQVWDEEGRGWVDYHPEDVLHSPVQKDLGDTGLYPEYE